MMQTVHLIIKGKVQGVFYRASTKEAAQSLGITGWVKNTPEGDVEVLAYGRQEAVKEFINWCKKGPSRAVVTDVIITEKENKAFDEFLIIR